MVPNARFPRGGSNIGSCGGCVGLNNWLSLNEHLFQGADTLFKVLHGHLASAPRGDCLGQLGNVLVQLVPTDTQGLCLGLRLSETLSDLIVAVEGVVPPVALLVSVL